MICERRRVRHMAVALTVDKFGLDPEFGSFGEKVHSARCLHATMRGVAKFSKCRKRIAVFNSLPSRRFPGNQCSGERLCIYVRNVSFPANEMGRLFHVSGITVNKTTQTVESVAAGGAFHIEDVYPLIDGGRFPVKRDRRRAHRRLGGYLSRRPRCGRRGAGLAPRARPRLAARADDPSQQRPLGRLVRPRRARPLCLCDRGLDRRVRHLAARLRTQAEGRRGPHPRRDRRRGHADQGAGRRTRPPPP